MSVATAATPAAAREAARHLDLQFRADGRGRTYLHRQFVRYPFHLTRPFHLDRPQLPGLATLYLQSASGGLYGGDRLGTDIALAEGAAAHVTSQSSTIVHRAHDGAGASLRTRLRLAPGAVLALTPDPTILFPGAELDSRIDAELPADACLILGEAMLGHDPQAADGLPARPVGRLFSEVRIQVPGLGRAIDRQGFAGLAVPAALDADAGSPGGPGYLAQAALYCIGPAFRDGPPQRLLAGLSPPPGCIWGADALPAGLGLWVRVLAPSGHGLTAAMSDLFAAAFTLRFGVAPAPRRK
ncbi:MAG: urease accessory protein UreD [Sneathiellaceae bacterium]